MKNNRYVVVYVSEDQVFSEPILKDFERAAGIKVKPLYDTEEAESTGAVNRLIAEKDNPQADVYWANEPIRAEVLKQKGICAKYISKNSLDIPKAFKQLSYTRDNRNEYKDLINRFYDIDSKKVTEKFAIVSNGALEKTQLEELENKYNIRVKKILHSEATTPIPDLKELL